jgi:hypothetical protein
MNPRAYRHFPSNIITEVSDEYKGSVRESVMNIEPDLSFKSTRQHFPSNLVTIADPPVEEGRRTVSGLTNASEYRKVENIVSGGQGSPYVRYGSGYTPQTVKAYEGSQQSSYQPVSSPRVVVKKEVTSPEEVNSASSVPSPSNPPVPIRQDSSAQLVSQQFVPASYRAINSNRVSEVISSPSLSRQSYASPIDQLRNIANPPQQAYVSPAGGREAKVTYTSSSGINWDDYEKTESDGRTIYRKKVNIGQTVMTAQQV